MGKAKNSGDHVSPLFYPIYYNFRVTFELLIRYRLEDYFPRQCDGCSSPDETEQLYAPVREHVLEVLQDASLKVNDSDLRESDGGCWTAKTNTVVTPLPHNRRDEYVNVLGFCPMEIGSPILRFHEKPGMNSFMEVEHMLRALRRNFKVIVNSTCGLRVEIGSFTSLDRDLYLSRGFPLQTLRNFIQLVTLFEFELNALHPVDRVLHADYCQLPSKLIKKSEDPVILLDRCSDVATLQRVWQEGMAMSDSLSTDIPPAYNISSLLGEPSVHGKRPSPKMIEFRQHASTIDCKEVYQWVKLAMHLIRFSHECGLGGLPAVLLRNHDEERHWPSGRFNTFSFLKAIGATEQAEYYRDKMKKYPRPLSLHFKYKEQNNPVPWSDFEVAYPDYPVWHVEKGTQ